MNSRNTKEELNPNDFWEVSHAGSQLISYACTVSARHLKEDHLRMQFNRELAYYAKRVVDDVEERRISPEEGLSEIKREQQSLLRQSNEIFMQSVGLISGATQVIAGGGICYASAGTLCAIAGIPMMAHGTNNVYENGRNLLEGHEETQGPLRKGYQLAAKSMGRDEREGDIAYSAIDVGLSVYGISRLVLKEDAWRLFRYVEADYIRSYKTMGPGSLTIEAISNTKTGTQLYRDMEK